ncbi:MULTISPECIES: metallophosphoesterase [Rhizobium]|uniref:Phosphatase n=1 Tax=Rhizobium johnstonii (strain DSM 114642 / LMG 32736 / 3841) TaxID=216596 RepID=Q1MH95_RHIJ3|nr:MULTISPECIES: metallophosphoesterase [Rhizobium]NEI92378.1 phosphatase [Rhizobium leguminosarum]NEJ79134.1 phosphatase [Rhizobium leguminosarum]CAK07671.1 putative phosphatase [Rhizobium johnstonii 3841]
MKLWVASDLHLEFGQPFSQTVPDGADIFVCAGDLLTRGIGPSISWLAANIAEAMPVVFVAGNHEFYGASMQESIRDARAVADRHPNIHYLENDTVDIGGVRFVGGTLWTDFRVLGGDPELAMVAAQAGMNDYRRIKFEKRPFRKFRPIHAYRKHQETRNFLASELRDGEGRQTVVVTHHAPSILSIEPDLRDDRFSACYASDLDSLIITTRPALWVHGHVHRRNDYMIGESRVVSNPRGYPGEESKFDPRLVIDI